MATLTESSIMARKSIRYFIYFIIFMVVARFSLIALVGVYKKIFPPAPTPPTVAFDKLPKLPFIEKQMLNLNFSVETADGTIPVFPDQAKVYFMPRISANLLSLDFAKENAKKMGFNTDPQQISDSLYRFSGKNAPSSMDTDIITGAFSLNYDFNQDPTPLSVKPPQPEIALADIKSLLSGAGLLPEDLSGQAEHEYLKTQSGGFVTALSLSDANIVRIDLFRKNYDELPVLTSEPKRSNVWFMVSGTRERGKEIVAGEYHYFPVDETQVATYPIKSGETAYQELTSGKYFPASYGQNAEGGSVKLRKIYLAYFDSGVYMQFLQPIYVFEGDKNFVGYVPAVTDEYYGE